MQKEEITRTYKTGEWIMSLSKSIKFKKNDRGKLWVIG